jgi:hypothetical protein
VSNIKSLLLLSYISDNKDVRNNDITMTKRLLLRFIEIQ